MRLVQQILTKNDCYTAGKIITVKGVMVHSTGANNPKVSRYVPGNDIIGRNTYNNHWDVPGIKKCVHAFLGKFADGDIGVVQTLPWNQRGWHCGTGYNGSANSTHISFEICEDGLTDPAYFQAVYQEAVELTAMLCDYYKLDPLKDGVVICHQEGYRRGIASNHGDVLHWFPKHGKTMDDFRNDVAKRLSLPATTPVPQEVAQAGPPYKTIEDVPSYYKAAVSKAVAKGALTGTSKDNLNVSEDLCRILTILDRLGKLD